MTADSKAFIDSNIWLYALTDKNEKGGVAAVKLIESITESITVSTQVINEVCLNLKRKSAADEAEINRLIRSFYLNYTVVEQNQTILLNASELRTKYSLSFWDGLIVASALAAGANILYSEDMQNGSIIEKSLKIVNPFV